MWLNATKEENFYFRLGRGSISIDKKDLSWRDIVTLWGKKEDRGRLYYYAFTLNQLAKMLQDSGFRVLEKYYAKNGKKVNCFTGNNLVIVAKRGDF